jgi:Mrp family chromosome partitioning ATPase
MGFHVNTDTNAQEFGQLRARLEATFPDPAIIVVTSAARGDGKTAVAFGLAQALAAAEHRVLFVDANVKAPLLPRVHRMPNLGGQVDISNTARYATQVAGERFNGLSFADERFESGMSLEKIKALAIDMRSQFDFVVVDTAQALKSDLTVLFSTVADGTLLTLRLGRLPSAADGATIKALAGVGANVLGVLTVTQSMVRSFAKQRADLVQPLRVPVRHVTSRHSIGPEPAREAVESRSNIVS